MKNKAVQKAAIIFLLLIFILVGSFAHAKDLGRVGQVYPIKEIDLLDYIHSRLKEMQKTGELEKINKEMQETVKKRADRPLPIKSITPTKIYRKWFIDPSIIIKDDITDLQGKVIVKGGTVVNPLMHVSLKSAFLIYDGDSKAQVAWAKAQNKRLNGKTKLILINGSITEQYNIFKRKILFDQHGYLVNKLKIEHTPAVVSQEGLKLKAEEVLV